MKYKYLIIILSLFIFASSNAKTKAINEEKFIKIGGIEQWVTIKADDSTKPVILFLHGGPGSTMSHYESVYSSWKKDFILANWDQRGAGRTFGRNAPENVTEDYWIENPLTVEQMAADGIEVAEYLIKHLGKQKIIIIGTSWGSVMGANMALKRPDLFYAYIGHSQVVDASRDFAQAYQTVLKMAQDAKDTESLDKLKLLGSPPYDDAKNTGQLFRVIKKYEKQNSVPAPASFWKVAAAYDNEKDAQHRYDGDDYSFINFAGHRKMGIKSMASGINFMKDGLNYKIPVYLIQGDKDITTPQEITKEYFDKLTTPHKKFILVPGATHGHNQAVIDAQYNVAKECLMPKKHKVN